MWKIAAIILEKRWVLAKMHFVSPHIIASLLSYIAYKSSSYSEKMGMTRLSTKHSLTELI